MKESGEPHPFPTTRLFAGTRRSALTAVTRLDGHLREIQAGWVSLLEKRLKLEPDMLRIVTGLKLRSQHKSLKAGDFKTYATTLEQHGALMASHGIPIETAVAAMALYMKACLPFISADSPGVAPLPFARFICASQWALIQGFTRHRQQEWLQLEQRLRESEQHFRRFSVHIVGLYEQTSRRIARDLHDEIGHNLLVLKLYLELMSVDLKNGSSAQIEQKIEEAVGLIVHAIDGVRRLAFNLGPAILEEAGLVPTLKRYAEQFGVRTGIKVRFRIAESIKLPSIYEVAIYRVLQGTLSNVVAHSAASNVDVQLVVEKSELLMSVEDDGKGFDIKKTLTDPSHAFGLMTIRQRVELIGGTLRMDSRTKRAGKRSPGTKIEVRIPLDGLAVA